MTLDTSIQYDLGPGVEAFSTRRESKLPYPVIQAHQVHGFRVAVVDRPDTRKEELDGYVTAGTLTREQDDLILKYYAEQMTLQQNGLGGGHGGRGGRGNGFGGGKGGRNGMGFGGGRDGRFGQQPGTVQNAPADPGEPAPEGSGV